MEKRSLILLGFLVFGLILGITGIVFAATSQSTTASVSVNEFLSVTLSNAPINFPNMDPGQTSNASVGNGFPLTATIGSETNVNVNVTTKADQTNFISGSNNLSVSNMEWSTNSSFPGTDYSTSAATVCKGISASSTCNIYHQLNVPSGQAAGAYTVGVTVSALKS
ncbi:hypothetical protein HYV50_04835 [Candidatus Pacearchaeota archaeon]|nr:hypothetical protein [Candidatus Pacearchaeota archaeon]